MTRKRPFGVTVIAVVQGLNAIVVTVLLIVAGVSTQRDYSFGLFPGISSPIFGLIGLIIAVGLWRLRRWAWVATMVWTGINMAILLYGYSHGRPQYHSMLLSVITVFYLNSRDVQAAFFGRTVHGRHHI
jgi:uncharacterized membrane protein